MITLNRSELSAALDQLLSLAKRKSHAQFTKHVLVNAGKKSTTLTATDLDMMATATVESEGAGFVALPPCAALAEIVRSMPGDTVNLDSASTKEVTVSSESSSYKLRALEPEEFPEAQKMDGPNVVELAPNAGFLSEALARSLPFIAADAVEGQALIATKLSVSGGRYTFDATDSKRAARYSFPAAGEAAEIKAALLTRDSVAFALSVLRSGAADVKLRIGGGKWEIATKKFRAVSRMLDGNFPDFARLAQEFTAKITVDRAALAAAVSRLASLRGEAEAVKVERKDGETLALSYANADLGFGSETVPAKVSAALAPFGLKASFILSALSAAKGESVQIEAHATEPGVLVRFSEAAETTGGAEWWALVAQIRL